MLPSYTRPVASMRAVLLLTDETSKISLTNRYDVYSDECARYSSTSNDWKALCSLEKDTFQACHFNDKALSKSEQKTRIDERNRYSNFKFLAFR